MLNTSILNANNPGLPFPPLSDYFLSDVPAVDVVAVGFLTGEIKLGPVEISFTPGILVRPIKTEFQNRPMRIGTEMNWPTGGIRITSIDFGEWRSTTTPTLSLSAHTSANIRLNSKNKLTGGYRILGGFPLEMSEGRRKVNAGFLRELNANEHIRTEVYMGAFRERSSIVVTDRNLFVVSDYNLLRMGPEVGLIFE